MLFFLATMDVFLILPSMFPFKKYYTGLLFVFSMLVACPSIQASAVYNPMSDTDWGQMTKDLGFSGVCSCPKKGIILGIKFHYWEPIATLEVVRHPFDMPSFGIKGNQTTTRKAGDVENTNSANSQSFYQVHYVKYPVLAVFQLASLVACGTVGSIDIGYMAEVDPTWNDEDLGLLMDFQALLANNPIAQLACLPDSLLASGVAAVNGSISVFPSKGVTQQQATGKFGKVAKTGKGGTGTTLGTKVQMLVPITNWLFWCAGGWGPMLPATGFQIGISDQTQSAALAAARALYKMQKYAMLWGTDMEWLHGTQNANGKTEYCKPYPLPHQFLLKDKYRLNIAVPLAGHAVPIGADGPIWEIGKGIELHGFVFVVWRFKKCCLDLGKLL